jgi:hypothetical protein
VAWTLQQYVGRLHRFLTVRKCKCRPVGEFNGYLRRACDRSPLSSRNSTGVPRPSEIRTAFHGPKTIGGCPPTPATPPCVRVRTRRFEKSQLLVDQRRKTERFEIGIGKPNRKSFGLCEIPGAEPATGSDTSQQGTHPSSNSASRRRRGVFHCRHIAALSQVKSLREKRWDTIEILSLPSVASLSGT